MTLTILTIGKAIVFLNVQVRANTLSAIKESVIMPNVAAAVIHPPQVIDKQFGL
jgi:hypothetical protein